MSRRPIEVDEDDQYEARCRGIRRKNEDVRPTSVEVSRLLPDITENSKDDSDVEREVKLLSIEGKHLVLGHWPELDSVCEESEPESVNEESSIKKSDAVKEIKVRVFQNNDNVNNSPETERQLLIRAQREDSKLRDIVKMKLAKDTCPCAEKYRQNIS